MQARRTRRDVIRDMAVAAPALLAGACGPAATRATASTPASSATRPAVQVPGFSRGVDAIPGLVAAFNGSQHAVRLQTPPKAAAGGLAAHLQVATITQYGLPAGQFEPLDSALRLGNSHHA